MMRDSPPNIIYYYQIYVDLVLVSLVFSHIHSGVYPFPPSLQVELVCAAVV